MQNLRDRLNTMIAELEAHPEVNLVCAFIGEPVPEADLAKVEAELGAPLDPDLRALYALGNGVSICWQAKPRTDADRLLPKTTNPVWYFEDSEGGHIIVEPIEEVFGPRMANHDIREVAAECSDGEPVEVFGEELDAEEFFNTTWVLSWFFENNAVMISSTVKDDQGRAGFVVQGDQGLEAYPQKGLVFGTWLEHAIASYGHTATQRRIYAGWDRIETPTLDEQVAAD